MVNHKTGKPRGFGFVKFTFEAEIEELLTKTHIIDNKEVCNNIYLHVKVHPNL